jgi:hypothetical protein
MRMLTPSGPVDPQIPVVIELGPALEQFRSDLLAADLEKHVTHGLMPLLQALRVPGQPQVMLKAATPGRMVRIRIHDVLQPFPAHLLRIAWWSTMPAPRRAAAGKDDSTRDARNYPDRWLTAHLAAGAEGRRAPQLAAFLAELVRQVVSYRPSCLMPATDPEDRTGSADHPLLPAMALERRVAAALLDLGAPLQNGPVSPSGPSGDGSVESLFERLRVHRIELRVHPGDLERLIRPQSGSGEEVWIYDESLPSELQQRFETFEVEQFALWGFRLPPSYFVPDGDVPSGLVAVKVNALLTTPMPGVPPQLAANGVPSWRKHKPQNAVGPHPQWPIGRDVSGFVGRRRDEEAGSPTWVAEVVIPTLAWVVDAAPERLIGISDVEYLIAQLDGGFPDLVRAALAQFSIPELTTLLRALVRERICIRDLRTILEALLEYEWVGYDPGGQLFFDERIVLPAETTPEVADDLAFRIEAVLRALAPQLDAGFDDEGDELPVAEVERSLEAQAERAAIQRPARSAGLRLTEAERERLLDDAWDAAGGRESLVVVTSAAARATIRKLLALELPKVTVLAREGLRHDRPIRRVGAMGERPAPSVRGPEG